MRKLLTSVLTLLVLISIAAPAWADVVSSPITPAVVEVFPILIAGCLTLFVIAAVVIGIVFIVKHNKKKSGEQ